MASSESYQAAQESEVSTSDSSGQEHSGLSAISSESVIAKLSFSDKCKKGTWILPRFGMTSKPSMEDHGVERWISSLQESHASHTALRADELARQMKETFGLAWRGSHGRWNQDSSWWKTSQASLLQERERIIDPSVMPPQIRYVENELPPYGFQIIGELQAMDYLVFKFNLSAAAVGANHRRDRVFILGVQVADTNRLWMQLGGVRWNGRCKSQDGSKTARRSDDLRDFRSGLLLRPEITRILGDLRNVPVNGLLGRAVNPSKKYGSLNPVWGEWLMGFPTGWTELKL